MLDHLGIERVGIAGWSSGGRVALALTARRPDLVDRVAIVATPAPDEAVPWQRPDDRAALEALRGLPPAEAHARLVRRLGDELPAGAAHEHYLARLRDNPADAGVLAAPDAAERLSRMMAAAFAQGTAGLAADIAGYCLQPWGFEPGQVRAKTLCLYGARDTIVPRRHGAWWRKSLPQARLEMVPDGGHLLLVSMCHRVLSFLAPSRRSS